MAKQTTTGIILRYRSGFYTVETAPHETVECSLRGRLKKGPKEGDIAALGDRVEITRLPEGTGVIESVAERKSAFIRLAPSARGEYQQVLLANPDQMLIVFACANPMPHLRMLDRFLVIAEKNGIPPIIVANKLDLVGRAEAETRFGLYQSIPYEVHYTSARSGEGVQALFERLKGRISALAGPSGVGKSSLLNAMMPGLGLAVSQVSDATEKGRHTTTHRELFPIDVPEGGYVADTPGMRSIALWDTEAEELDGYFPELRGLVQDCQFSDCTHREWEPGCAVRLAVEEGRVHPERYLSYVRLRYGEEEDEFDLS
ncbi:MAG: ribosome small subunit-dependent GTPase A [Anaerolineae bacterium]|nr:ribosome small subunit-dependent GTPase A [Anaerolineae bacterium]